jgi:hypothetical protein
MFAIQAMDSDFYRRLYEEGVFSHNTIRGQGFMGFAINSGGKYVFPRDQE